MRTVLCCTVAALLAPGASLAAEDTLPHDRARMYPQPAAQVWQAALETLAALKLKTDDVDTAHQFVVTKFRSYGDSSVAGPDVPGYRAYRFQLHVFVSPFAEPARVHVASVSELQKIMSGGKSTMYAAGVAENWFLDALDARLGTKGRSIPLDPEARMRQAADMGGTLCQPRGDDGTPPREPAKIEASEVKVMYPYTESSPHKAVVVLQFQIGEDGAIYGMTVAPESTPHEQFRNSAQGAAWLLRYVPSRFKGCYAPTMTTYTMNYKSLAHRGR